MGNEEPDIKEFLTRIASLLSMTLLWLLVNCTIGIGLNFAFFDDKPTAKNYIFYGWFVFSFILLIIYFRRKMRSKISCCDQKL